MLIAFTVLVLFVAAVYLYMQQPQFGKAPSGARLERIQQSPNYRDGQFHNESHTPALTEGASYIGILSKFLFGRNKNGKPAKELPTQKIDLRQLPADEDVLVWFGHSSYFMQVDGKTFLVDPVLSGSASPVRFTTRSFTGSDAYAAADLPDIDYLLITHDHWDHLDYATLQQLKPRIRHTITGLGTGAHLEHWGFSPARITEADWYQTLPLEAGITVHTAPARHFSGRGLKRNGVLWLSFVLHTPRYKIFLGGDSGFDTHFEKIGAMHGPFDLAILENGQYDLNWKYIHMMPEEVVTAARNLHAKSLMAVHWGKFTLANHDWDEPINRVQKASRQHQMPLLTPMIGEPVYLQDSTKQYSNWWENLPGPAKGKRNIF